MGSRISRSVRRSAIVIAAAALLLPLASSAEQLVQTFALNGYKRVLDGQWQGIRYASDGNVYFGSSTHSAHHGAAFFKYDSTTRQVTLLAEDLTTICGEDPQTNPQGKLHSDIVEAHGWLYMATHFSSELPGAYDTWTGSHVIGYELATGQFRDYGVVHPNYTTYSAIGVDPARNYLYVFVTGQLPTQVSYLYRIHTVTGAKTNLGQVGTAFNASGWTFVDRRGDVWFSVLYSNGALRRVRADTGQIDVYPNALPPMYRWDVEELASPSDQASRWIMWMQPLDGDRALFTLGYFGGMLYLFDASRPIGSGQEFQPIKHIGFSDLGLAVGGGRVFYSQRANRGYGQQEARDFHLLSVSLDPGAGYPITDHGLLKDREGRVVWRLPGMATDGQGRVFMIGDWWTIPGDLGTLRYRYSGGVETYDQLPRGEFFAIAEVDRGFYTVTPCRVADTRDPAGLYGGPALVHGVERGFVIAGRCGVPSTATAVSLNVTVTEPTGAGHLAIYPTQGNPAPTSVLNFRAGQTRANGGIFSLDGTGALHVNGQQTPSAGSLHVLVDVNGYFR